MGMKWSKSNACLFFKQTIMGETILLASCHVNDTMVVGSKEKVEKYKCEVQLQFKIKDMGPLTCYLGICYSWSIDEHEERLVAATMNDLIHEIIKVTKKHVGTCLLDEIIPAKPNQVLGETDGPTLD